jgi:ferredoxin
MNVTIDPDKCRGCLECVLKCAGEALTPKKAVTVISKRVRYAYRPTFNVFNCIDCMACTEPGFCPNNAIEVNQ